MISSTADQSSGAVVEAADLSSTALTRSEERLLITHERAPIGTAVLRKVIVVERRTITVEVAHEEFRLEYLPLADGYRDAARSTSLALPEFVLHEEQLVITKRTVPIERVRPVIVNVPGENEVTETLRHEEITLTDPAQSAGRNGPDDRAHTAHGRSTPLRHPASRNENPDAHPAQGNEVGADRT